MAQIVTQYTRAANSRTNVRPMRRLRYASGIMMLRHLPPRSTREFIRRAIRGEAHLWQVWWLAGIPVIAAATWVGMKAEDFRFDEEHVWGAILDTFKFMLCLFWLVVAWRCSHNVGNGFWRGTGRLAIALSVLFVGLTY